MACIISSSRFKLISTRSSLAPPRGPCSQTLTATSVLRSRRQSARDPDGTSWAPSLGTTWLVASITRLNVPRPRRPRDLHRRFFWSERLRALKYSKLSSLCFNDPSEESLEDSLGGGVGGLVTVAVNPRDSARCISRLMVDSSASAVSILAWEPDTAIGFLGIDTASGTYSLTLRFLPCWATCC